MSVEVIALEVMALEVMAVLPQGRNATTKYRTAAMKD
jgi:hypothetical protein